MNIFADECCDALLIRDLRATGHDVAYAKERFPGEPDEVVLQTAFDEDRYLLTEDKDFGELVYRLAKPARCVILLRIDVTNSALKLVRLTRLFETKADRLSGSFVVVEPGRFRIRPLKAFP